MCGLLAWKIREPIENRATLVADLFAFPRPGRPFASRAHRGQVLGRHADQACAFSTSDKGLRRHRDLDSCDRKFNDALDQPFELGRLVDCT